jgi:hypothetical protein
MTPPTLQFTPGTTAGHQGPVVVELGTRQLPPRMRLGRLRSSVGISLPHAHRVRRVVMAPVAMMMRLFSR